MLESDATAWPHGHEEKLRSKAFSEKLDLDSTTCDCWTYQTESREHDIPLERSMACNALAQGLHAVVRAKVRGQERQADWPRDGGNASTHSNLTINRTRFTSPVFHEFLTHSSSNGFSEVDDFHRLVYRCITVPALWYQSLVEAFYVLSNHIAPYSLLYWAGPYSM